MDYDEAVALIRPGAGTPGETWADLGAGSGTFTTVLSNLLGPSGTVYAIDRDVRAVEQLRALKTFGATIRVRQADLTQPLGLTDLDGLLLANALHFVARPERALRGLAGTLRPGGRLLVVEYDTRQRTPWDRFRCLRCGCGSWSGHRGLVTRSRSADDPPASAGGSCTPR